MGAGGATAFREASALGEGGGAPTPFADTDCRPRATIRPKKGVLGRLARLSGSRPRFAKNRSSRRYLTRVTREAIWGGVERGSSLLKPPCDPLLLSALPHYSPRLGGRGGEGSRSRMVRPPSHGPGVGRQT